MAILITPFIIMYVICTSGFQPFYKRCTVFFHNIFSFFFSSRPRLFFVKYFFMLYFSVYTKAVKISKAHLENVYDTPMENHHVMHFTMTAAGSLGSKFHGCTRGIKAAVLCIASKHCGFSYTPRQTRKKNNKIM